MKNIIDKHYKKIIIIIFLFGILFRAIYVIKSPIKENQYDSKIGLTKSLEDYEGFYKQNEKNIGVGGHLFYIMTIYKTMKLPNGTGGQYYHPPLFHFLSALWLKGMDFFPLNAKEKIESLQILSLIFSVLILIYLFKIIEKTKISKEGKILSYLLINFFPMFIYLSGFVNNDLLITLFVVMNIYYLIKWNENTSIKNTLFVAFSLGLGMMTKTSIMIMMLPIVVVVLLKLIQNIKTGKKIKKIIIEILIFIVIVGTLGLWYQIRNHNKYGVDYFMIQKPYDHFYSGDVSNWERWGFTSKDFLKNKLEVEDKNILACVINSSLYCLQTEENFYGYMIKELTILLFVFSLIAIAKQLLKINKNEAIKNILLLIYFTWILGFIYFNISLPYSCTMNSRYIPIVFIISGIMLGYETTENKRVIVKYLLFALSAILSILSPLLILI